MKKIEINIESIEEKYLEHPYTPNRKDNYLPNQMVISNTQFTRVEQRLFEYFINQINYNTININHGVSVKIPITTVRETIKPEQILAVTKSMAQKVMTFLIYQMRIISSMSTFRYFLVSAITKIIQAY
jgi:hypothetical protein